VDERCGVGFIFSIEMRKHFLGMYAGVGSAGAHKFDVGSENYRKCFVHRFLYGYCVGLGLPAVVMGAVVRKSDEVTQEFWFF
jgi:hypothetical protein